MYPKIIATTIVTVLIGALFYQVAYANDYDGLDLPEKFGEYHLSVNEITNSHFTALFAFFEDKTDLEAMTDTTTVQRLTAPEDLDTCRDDEDINFSSSCLAYKLNLEYQELTESLQEDLEEADTSLLQSQGDITRGISNIGIRNQFAAEQLELSSELQRQTVAFYQQTLMAYPLHVQYQITIDELNKFLSNVRQINRKVSNYPSKFHNASTALCT